MSTGSRRRHGRKATDGVPVIAHDWYAGVEAADPCGRCSDRADHHLVMVHRDRTVTEGCWDCGKCPGFVAAGTVSTFSPASDRGGVIHATYEQQRLA